jgi:transcriptional repressor NrdR
MVMERLRALDQIAYIRFASVYRAFADVEALERELEALKAGWARRDVPPDQLPLLPDAAADARPKRKRHRRKRGAANQLVQFPTEEVQQRKAEGR